MKLVNLNIWQGRIIRHIVPFLQEERPDFVCLQEMLSANGPIPITGWDCFSAYETLQEKLPELKYWFFAPLFSYDVRGRKVTAGNAIGSRYPIDNKRIAFTNGEYADGRDPIPNTRNFQTCQITLTGGKQLSLVNHHAYWADADPAGSPESVVRMRKVKQATDKLPKPLIVCGDMNVTPESETMQVFAGSLRNLTDEYKLPTTLTPLGAALNRNNMVACDHILVSDDVIVQDFTASEKLVSDHKALILEFKV